MATSKCTCKHRIPVHVRDRNYPHEADCYSAAKLKQEDQDRENCRIANILFKVYRRRNQAGE